MNDGRPAVPSERGAVRPGTIVVELSGRTLLLALGVVALLWLASRLPNFLLIVVFGALLATAIDQPVGALHRRGLPRPIGILFFYLLLLALAALVVAVLVPLVAAELAELRATLPAYVGRAEQTIRDRFGPTAAADVSLDRLAEQGSGSVGIVAQRLTSLGLEVGRTAILVFVTLVVAFFLAADPGVGERALARLLPPAWSARLAPVARDARLRIGAWARGQVLIAAIFGLAMGVGLELLGVPFAASLGVVAGVLELLPYVGGFITVVLAGLTALTVGVPQFAGVLVLYVVLVNLEAHVLAPLLFGRAVGLPPIAILLALLAGVELLGIAGALLAVPATVVAWVLLRELVPDPAAPPPAETPPAGRARVRRVR